MKASTLTTLDKLDTGRKSVITAVGGSGQLRRRLLDLGLTPQTIVMVRKVAPLGDPIELYLRGYELTLRKAEASAIQVSTLEYSSCISCNSCVKCKQFAENEVCDRIEEARI